MKILDWLKNVIGYLKLKPRYLFGLSVVCFVIVGLPKACRLYLGYDELIQPYRGWISLLGVASGVYWFVMIAAGFPQWVLDKFWSWVLQIKAATILRKLSRDEKEYIAKYIQRDISSCDFHLGDGIINSLKAKRVVYQASSLAKHGPYFAFNLQPWVLRALNTYPDLKEDILKHGVEFIKIGIS